jgi:hypothetical protein
MIPVTSITTPSPKTTEKVNPFSSVSPKLNPFVKIVESREEPFLERSTSQSSQSSTNSSSKPIYSVPAAKSFFTTFKDKDKLSVNTSSVKSSPASTSLPSTSSIDKVHDVPPIKIAAESLERLAEDQDADQDPNNTERDEADGDDEADDVQEEPKQLTFSKVYHLPDNVIVSTGEENEDCLSQLRAKLYRWIPKTETDLTSEQDQADSPSKVLTATKASASSDGMWVEVGVGPVRFLREKKASVELSNLKKTRIVMRREEKKGGHGEQIAISSSLCIRHVDCM